MENVLGAAPHQPDAGEFTKSQISYAANDDHPRSGRHKNGGRNPLKKQQVVVPRGPRLTPILDTCDVARELGCRVDRVLRIPRSQLPYMTEGGGRRNLYLAVDVVAYVRRNIDEQSLQASSSARQEVLETILDSAPGRSKGRTP